MKKFQCLLECGHTIEWAETPDMPGVDLPCVGKLVYCNKCGKYQIITKTDPHVFEWKKTEEVTGFASDEEALKTGISLYYEQQKEKIYNTTLTYDDLFDYYPEYTLHLQPLIDARGACGTDPIDPAFYDVLEEEGYDTEILNEEIYVLLTCTAHGMPIAKKVSDPNATGELIDQGVFNPPPKRVIGPFIIGPKGYKNIAEAMANWTENISLNDPMTWFDNPKWIKEYLVNLSKHNLLNIVEYVRINCKA